ncbi:MAG: site-specific integrase [Nocardiopsaceae bacterium]|jgi:site-specific recombinase XerD|nr:site-specific integrase [Nocardiopsaceae bacterium]
MTLIASTMQAFFSDRLITERNCSPETVASYRDTMRLLLAYAQEQTGKPPFQLDFDDLDAPLISSFLTHLEADRHNSTRTRNNRLAAIHSLFRYAALNHPEHSQIIARVMAIPTKRCQPAGISYLDLAEIQALLTAPDQTRWLGRRDRALLLTLIQTGVRVSELTGLHVSDIKLGATAFISVLGKGRKRRTVTLTRETARVLHGWLTERQGQPSDPLFPTVRGKPLSRDAVEWLLAKHVALAATRCSSLASKRITPHVLRHTNAMLLKANDVDIATIALWLGHERIQTTQIYQHADPRLKEEAIARVAPLGVKPGRYRPSDQLLAFLEAL